ncbi:non-functional NADPH-dependent codeinone reductase 2-like [Impatiens glandulifera]|uniref:non-functional NADPH-dependent codeinone reductase 2-like n=1 Tax=Impatiens glandulifera TaxID=253017 RepID=UPI001FB1253B|nr:non-functional NADPH-dependent codeinone reductase 2-like [Impatiens glandulifera]
MAGLIAAVPEFPLSHGGRKIPAIGMGTASSPPAEKQPFLEAIECGYRHFDTASLYRSEQPLGEAITEALSLGLIKSRDELFITSKLWCTEAHPHLVLPSLQKTLSNLKLEYLDLYLVHWPMSVTPGKHAYPPKQEDIMKLDYKGVWASMEECHKLGLAKSIGVSNFTCKKLADLLLVATIPPSVNQVEMSPVWQQKKLRDYCKAENILLEAFSPLGAHGSPWGKKNVVESKVIEEIAEARGKTIAQVCLRWIYEQGVVVVVKSFNKERMKENLNIFDWALSEEELKKIAEDIPQGRIFPGESICSETGLFKSINDLWDGEI